MSTITKEQLRERAREKVKSLEFAVTQTAFADSRAELEEELELARIALASLEAEPVCYLTWHQGFRAPDDCEEYVVEAKPSDKSCDGSPAFPVYSAPQAPVSVPDEMTMQKALSAIDQLSWQECTRDAYMLGWNACRAAMLQGAEPVTAANKLDNPTVIPDGLRLALSNAGIAAPESDEMLAATCEKYIQALVTWVKDRKPFRSAVVSDGWVACSERIPENKPGSYEYLVFDGLNNRVQHDYWNVPDAGDDCQFTPFWNHYDRYVTHWMPLPAAPQQEAKNV